MDQLTREMVEESVATADHPTTKTEKMSTKGLHIDSLFCPEGQTDPFATVEWDLRTAAIKGDGGEVIFEQHDCEVPATWSQLATNVVANKYLYGELGTEEREKGVRQLIGRVCRTIADWGIDGGYFATSEDGERFYRDLAWLCLHQHASFNSPVWFNVGLYHQYGVKGARCNWHWNRESGQIEQPENPYEYPQASACFIQGVSDNMEDIMELARSEAMLFKFGSGTGTDVSTLRSQREKLSGGGKPSGPLSFMRVYDQIAAVVKSGGKTRRAAKMQSIKDWHPDVMEFIECKSREEKKVRTLVEEGYDPQEAYDTVLFQNANFSVRLSDDFMRAVETDKPWTTHWVTDPKKAGPTYPAREMFAKIAASTWCCGDPGVQYDTTVNRWHTCPNSGRINASNPCSEYMFLDDSACNLASINLMKYRRDDGVFDYKRFMDACRVVFIAQEILVDRANYPTKAIAANSHRFRPLGLGYSNLGSLIMAAGLPYDSDEARGLCGAITAILHGTGYLTSTELAEVAGPFEEYEKNREPMLRVMEMHWKKVDEIETCPKYLQDAARELWDKVLTHGKRFGFRNAQATVLAPTGTISFMMDCDTTGIEPDIALVKYKQLAGGGMLKMVNRTVPPVLRSLGYTDAQIEAIADYIDKHDTIEGAPELKPEHLPIFDCAFPPRNGKRSISWRAHIRMMAAAQPFVSGAISKTVNMPNECTPEDVSDAYMEGWRLGLKALAIYRDGSKEVQPLSTKAKADRAAEKLLAAPRRERLPDTRNSITHKFNISGHEGYITVGLYPDGRPGELFITMAKEGSTIGGMMDCFGTAISMSLQYGVPLEVYVSKFSHTRFEPMGFTKNPDVRIAKSIVDYIFRWLGITFLPGYREANKPVLPATADPAASDNGDSDPESRTAATTDGGQNQTHGSAMPAKSPNGSDAVSGNGRHGPAQSQLQMRSRVAAMNRMAVTLPSEAVDEQGSRAKQFASFQSDAPACDNCGSITVRSGNCYLCYNCGSSMGCS
ncbi:MAG: vitamin B12-dependent ribonucleotide reductase [Pirellulales bacterium]|nr:vitamin B12-dependent ribonucleotide reductase [Pirellulales bacterium]